MGKSLSMPLPSIEWLPCPSSPCDQKQLEKYGIKFGIIHEKGIMVKVTMDKTFSININRDKLEGTASGYLFKNNEKIAFITWRDSGGKALRANITMVHFV